MTFPHFNQWRYHGITILDDININAPQYQASVQCQAQKEVPKTLGFGDGVGSLTLSAATDRGVYCAGENIALKVVVKNETKRNLGKLKVNLVQKVVYRAEKKTKTENNVIRIVEGAQVMKGEDRVWNDQLLVDFIPPSTKASSCRILAVSYFVKVLVEVPTGHTIDIDLPITIGTIPFGHTAWAPTRGATAGTSSDVGVTSAIAYTKCNRGFKSCIEDDEFSNFKYVPMCSYVVNTSPHIPQWSALASV